MLYMANNLPINFANQRMGDSANADTGSVTSSNVGAQIKAETVNIFNMINNFGGSSSSDTDSLDTSMFCVPPAAEDCPPPEWSCPPPVVEDCGPVNQPIVAANEKARIWGDPHIDDADGGKYNFNEKGVFNLLEDSGIFLNVKTDGPQGNGKPTYVTEAGLTIGNQQVNIKDDGTTSITSGHGEPVILEDGKAIQLEDGSTLVKKGKVINLDTSEYQVKFDTGRKHNNTSFMNIDVKTKDAGVMSDGQAPIGLLGETFDADRTRQTRIKEDKAAYQRANLFDTGRASTPASSAVPSRPVASADSNASFVTGNRPVGNAGGATTGNRPVSNGGSSAVGNGSASNAGSSATGNRPTNNTGSSAASGARPASNAGNAASANKPANQRKDASGKAGQNAKSASSDPMKQIMQLLQSMMQILSQLLKTMNSQSSVAQR